MSSRIRGLQRLADLYGIVERMHSVDLRVASDAVNEAAKASEAHREMRDEQTAFGRTALEQGDRQGWIIAESQGELAESMQARVEQVRRAREIRRQAVMDAYRASRLRMEQMQQIVRRAREREAAEEERRMQAAMDDRYLSRREWLRSQAAAAEDSERSMNRS